MISIEANLIIESENEKIEVARNLSTVTFNFSSWKIFRSFYEKTASNRRLINYLKEDILIEIRSKPILTISKGKIKKFSPASLLRIIWLEFKRRFKK